MASDAVSVYIGRVERASDRAYRVLRDEIISWHALPGTPLAEVELAARLGMSRTPVREALTRLAEDGLVVAVGGRGLVVAPLDEHDIRALYVLRAALEPVAARLAAQTADPATFHGLAEAFDRVTPALDGTETELQEYYRLIHRFDEAIDDAVDNDYLAAALRSAHTHAARIRRASRDNRTRLAAAADEHAEIARAIAAGNPDIAEHATRLHLHRSLANALATMHEAEEARAIA